MTGITAGLAFRRAEPDDVEIIRRITREAYAKWVSVIGREPLPMTFDFSDLVNKHRIELSMDGSNIVGLVQLIAMENFMLLENIAVVPARQAGGLGSALLSHGEAITRQEGFSQMRLYTNLAFTENIKFYGRRGYQITSFQPFRRGVMVNMAKSLI